MTQPVPENQGVAPFGVTPTDVRTLVQHIGRSPVATDPDFGARVPAVTDENIALWIDYVAAGVQARTTILARYQAQNTRWVAITGSARTAVLNGAAAYTVSAGFPTKAGTNEAANLSAELWARYQEQLEYLERLPEILADQDAAGTVDPGTGTVGVMPRGTATGPNIPRDLFYHAPAAEEYRAPGAEEPWRTGVEITPALPPVTVTPSPTPEDPAVDNTELAQHVGTLNNAVISLDGRVTTLETTSAQLTQATLGNAGRIQTLETTTGTHSTEIAALNNTATTAATNAENAVTTANQAADALTALTTTVTTQGTTLDSKTDRTETTALTTQVGEQETTLGTHTTRITALDTTVATHTTALATKADATALAEKADAATVDTLATTVATHTSELGSLSTALAGKADTAALATKADASVVAALATTVGGHTSELASLTTALGAKADTTALATKADASVVAALSTDLGEIDQDLAVLTGQVEDRNPDDRVTTDAFLAQPVFTIAHRGTGDVYPEHTLAAYTNSIASGAQAVEVSVHLTADGIPVCHHDADLERSTGVTGEIYDYTLAELRNLTTDFRTYLGPNTVRPPIPTLDEVLREIAGKAVIFLEAKVARAQPAVLQAIADFGIQDSVVVKIYRNGDGKFDGNTSFVAQAASLGYTTWCYLSAGDTLTDITALASSPNVHMLGVPHYENLPAAGGSSMTDAQIREVVALGKPVICWEVHRRAVRDHMVGLGVRGIMCSNYLWVAHPEKYTTTAMNIRRGVRWPGAVPGGDQNTANMPTWDTANGRLLMSQAFDSSFHLSPLSNHTLTTYTLNVTLGWPTGAPTSDAYHAGIVFGAAIDEAWGFSSKHANAKSGSYMLIWRGAGRIMLMKYPPGATSGIALGTITGPAPADGLFLTFHIAITPTGITITADTVTPTITTTDTDYRGRHVHLVKNYSATGAGAFALAAPTITTA